MSAEIEQQIGEIKESIRELTKKLEELKEESKEVEQSKIRLEQRKTNLDAARLLMERQKHKVELWDAQLDLLEKGKLNRSPKLKFFVKNATTLSILVPLVVALATLAYSAYSAYQLAQSNFELKVAEMVVNSNSPEQAKVKADSLATMFPDRLTAVALTAYNPTQFSEPDPERRKQLIDLIQAHPERKEQTIQLWKEVFPEDAAWVDNITIDSTMTGTPIPPKQANALTATPVSQIVQSTSTPAPVPTCEAVVIAPPSGGSGRSWIGSWEDLAKVLHDNPKLLDELMVAQDQGFLDFLKELSRSQSVVDQMNEDASDKLPGGGILQGTSQAPIIQHPLNPTP